MKTTLNQEPITLLLNKIKTYRKLASELAYNSSQIFQSLIDILDLKS